MRGKKKNVTFPDVQAKYQKFKTAELLEEFARTFML